VASSSLCPCRQCRGRSQKDKDDGISSENRSWPNSAANMDGHLGDESGDGVRRKKDRAILEGLIDSCLAGLKEMRGERPSVESDAREGAG
jgi:hypothetical protein